MGTFGLCYKNMPLVAAEVDVRGAEGWRSEMFKVSML